MIEFKPISIEDKSTIESYTLCSSMQNCDLSFANMYCWQSTFRSEWAIIEGYLIIRFHIDGGDKLGYMAPIGKCGKLNFAHLIPIIAQDAHSNGDRLTIVGLNDEGRQALRAIYQDKFAFYSDRNYEDYIYSRKDLELLQGKKYQPKRNHFNKFKLYDFEYRPLTPDLFDQCLELDRKWQNKNNQSNTSFSSEQDALERAFQSFEKLNLIGGAILIENKVIAFTYGSAINEHTFCIHIEKADTNYQGAYTAINQLFVQNLPPQFEYINREEDLGIEGLRRSKLSYYPTSLQEKYNAIYLHYDEQQCKKLWIEVFGDDVNFVDEFIIKHYQRQNMLSMVDHSNNYVSMVHIIPFESEIGRCAYIYGVATHENYRGHGHASKLMTEAVAKITREGYVAALLIPSEKWLHGFYSRFGFKETCKIYFQSYNNFDFGTGDIERDIAMVLPLSDIIIPQTMTLNKL